MATIRPLRSRIALTAFMLVAIGTGGANAQLRPSVPVTPPPAPALNAPAQSAPALTPPMPIPNVPGDTLVPPPGSPPPPMVLPEPAPPPPAAAPAPSVPRMRAGEGQLQVIARFGAQLPAITAGLHWRVYPDKPDQAGAFRLVKEERSAQPTFVLPTGGYVVHVSFGLASTAKPVQVRADAQREVFEIAAGALTMKGQVGDVRIPTGQISFDVYKGSQFEPGEKRPLASSVATNDTVLLPEGAYYIVSKYGDGNSVVRSDIRIQAGKLTDVTVTHRAAAIMLKLVSKHGGEALANTDWAVLSPAGDTITESKGAFPRVILAEGEYKVIARSDNKVYQQDLRVITGVDGEIEVIAR
jgi:hypothetical protein